MRQLPYAMRFTGGATPGNEEGTVLQASTTSSSTTISSTVGSFESIDERLQELRERYGISYFSVFPKDSDAFAPVVARLARK